MLRQMRTTIRLDDHLFREAKKLAAESGRTLTAVIEDALRETLARARGRRAGKRPPRLPTFSGALRPGIDLDSNASVLDAMEGDEWLVDPSRR